MNETIVGAVFSDDVLSDVRSTVMNVIGGLNSIAQMLEAYGADNASVSRGHFEVMARTLLNGSVDVWYRGRYMTVPLRQLTDWFNDPVKIGAANFDVAESVFRRWMNCEHENGVGSIFVPCNHTGCGLRRMLSFYDPREMQQAESRAASEIWYCHHHRLPAWESYGILGDEHLDLLKRVHDTPGCSLAQLGGQKRDTDFLMSIGVLASFSPAAGNRKTYAFQLTSSGVKIVKAWLGCKRIS
ncbi:hypothetical protein WS84_19845 [Burkholderia anthina]|uniref:hypothetical protein n=1 Tax=Burkholderia anthina TaxID=179879 RepID=UPI00075B1128|nr:hypothetical protein [Burkholderia anthina]KVH09161.1 hypothetical protein WS84_19845 [Burkholderia anthina]